MKKLFLTGGCGFIGSNFLKRFLKTHTDWKVLNFDKLTYAGNPANVKELEGAERYEFVKGDVADPKAVAATMQGAEAVVHFAAETHVDRSIARDEDFLVTNVLGTRVMLEAARTHAVKRYLHISTDEVYGSIAKGFVPEDAPLRPGSPYSASKAAGDLLVESYNNTYGLGAMIVRSANNFGPYQFPEKVIPLFVTNLLEGKKVPLYAKGENRRDWTYVEDNCAAIELILDKGRAGETYNVGAGNERTNLELTKAILRLMGEGEGKIQHVADRPGHDFRYGIDCGKIRDLGFKPQSSFEEGLSHTIEWYRRHREWWEPLKKDKFTVK